MKYRKKILKKICTSVFCMVLSLCMVLRNGVMTAYAWSADELALFDYNTSDKIYRWTRVRSVDEMRNIFEGEGAGKDMRLLLIPIVSHGANDTPTFEQYYILADEEDELDHVDLSQNPWIDLSKDEFFTQGGFRTPYVEYDGMKDDQYVQSCFGEPVPTIRLISANKDDTKGNNVLHSAWDIINDHKQKTKEINKLHELKPKKDQEYRWEIGFPGQHDHTNITKEWMLGKPYHNHIKDLVQVAIKVKSRNDYLLINDDGACIDAYWELVEETTGVWWCVYSETYYKCYIGVEGAGVHQIEGTQIVGSGQTVILDKFSYLKPKATLQINEGGTVFVKGEFVNSGNIVINGGTLVLQKGALMYANHTSGAIQGNIYVENGDLIVREGARMINFDPNLKNNDQCSLYIKPGGLLVNRGLVALSGDILVYATGEFKNQGNLVVGCELLSNQILYQAYSPETTDLSADEFARKATEEMMQNLLFCGKKSVKLVDINGANELEERGVFRNEGEVYALSK